MCPVSQQLINHAIQNPNDHLSCMHFHQGINCNTKMVQQFIGGFKSIFKMYLIVHLVPFLLFKRKKTKQNPKKQISKLIIAFAKSILFAGGYSALVRRFVCLFTTLYNSHGVNSLLAAIFSSVTLSFQPVSRQSQIALFCLNKTIETSYNMARRRKYPVKIPFGQGLLMAFALSIISYHYFNNKQSIRQNYSKMIDKILSNA